MPEHNSGSILLVDDDLFIVEVYQAKFTEAGLTTMSAQGVDQALKLLREGFAPDVVFFDIEMKEKNGFAFLEAIKQENLAQGAYLIAFTNHSSDVDKQKALELGARSYVIKAEMIPNDVVKMAIDAIAKKRQTA